MGGPGEDEARTLWMLHLLLCPQTVASTASPLPQRFVQWDALASEPSEEAGLTGYI